MYWTFRMFINKIHVFVSCGHLSVYYHLFFCVCVCLPIQLFYSKLWNTDCDLSFFSENRKKSHIFKTRILDDNFNFDYQHDFCFKASLCREPQDVGPCSDYTVRWWYNRATYQCQQFVYGGCLGNGNNFETELACLQRCRR